MTVNIIVTHYFLQHTHHLDNAHKHDPLVENQLDIHLHKMFLVQIDYLIITSHYVIAYQYIITCDNSLGHDSTHNEPEWNLKSSLVSKDSVSELYTRLGGQSATQVPLLSKFPHAYIRYVINIVQLPWQPLTIHWSSRGPVQPAAHSLLQHWGFCSAFK